MNRIKKSIFLTDYRNDSWLNTRGEHFRIDSIKNSTKYIAGDMIEKKTVDVLISQRWEVTIKPKK